MQYSYKFFSLRQIHNLADHFSNYQLVFPHLKETDFCKNSFQNTAAKMLRLLKYNVSFFLVSPWLSHGTLHKCYLLNRLRNSPRIRTWTSRSHNDFACPKKLLSLATLKHYVFSLSYWPVGPISVSIDNFKTFTAAFFTFYSPSCHG